MILMSESSAIPQPISRSDAKRIWNLMKQKEPLSGKDRDLVKQAAEFQMYHHHGIRLKPGSEPSEASSEISSPSRGNMIVS